MIRVLLVAGNAGTQSGLGEDLAASGFVCADVTYDDAVIEAEQQSPDLVLVEVNDPRTGSPAADIVRTLKQERKLPVMALVPAELLDSLDGQLEIDDFITSPVDARELAARVKRLLKRGGGTGKGELITFGSLVIDLATCEVTVDGRIVALTFKEYEMLKLLAGNPGRVYTRESLLNNVWGYDYLGGDRTVDVHIRRLRSKIEDAHYTYIETVRNIGYRFRKET